MIELGGKIRLEGFEALDPAELLIAKKLVGSYIRKVCDEAGECDSALLTLEESKGYTISVEVIMGKQVITATASGENIFMTIDQSLKATLQKLGLFMQ